MMRILCVYQGDEFASSRIRILQMRPHLEARGLACEVAAYPRSARSLAVLCRRAVGFDLVWLQKKLPSLVHALLWRRVTRPIVFDFDDAIRFRKESRRGSYRSATRERRFRAVTRLAASFTCGNRHLASLVESRGKPVLIYPSPVPIDVPRRDYGAPRSRWALGWIGDRRNLGSLGRIVPQLVEVARTHALVLRVISNGRFDAPGLTVENVDWSLERQETLLADLDVGLMPLDARSPFDTGKCSYKLLQCMAAGVASVADAVGMNVEVVADGRNGRLVHEPDAWAAVLGELLAGGLDLLRSLGAEGRKTVEAGFTYSRHAEALVTFFRELPARSSAR
jgi:glycosyltransferase involved in cell wall biosynthesis